jgi:mono/diheme cytochrome c family protein
MAPKIPQRPGSRVVAAAPLFVLALCFVALAACKSRPPLDPEAALIAKGRKIFLTETFEGNGRTCATCHRAEDNFGITPAFIATLPPDDPLFVAETNPDLAENFENPRLMRAFALILENQDGFDDLANNFNMRGVPHTLALSTSVDSTQGPRTGWSGDGAPGDGSLRAFATGAVIQHFTLTTNRIPGVDFRLPTEQELDALEAFQLSLGRQEDLALPLALKSVVAGRGQEIFRDNTLGKCNACHFNAGANGDPNIFGPGAGNLNFDTGVEALPDQPADLTGEPVPPDDGFGTPGDGNFNTPTLVEAADTGPFFHNNSVETIEGAVAFYNGDAFNTSPAGQLLAGATGSGINLDGTQVVAVAAFLRVINALENIRSAIALLEQSQDERHGPGRETLELATAETEDSIQVLSGGGLHPAAAIHLEEARRLTRKAARSFFQRGRLIRRAIEEQEKARDELVE